MKALFIAAIVLIAAVSAQDGMETIKKLEKSASGKRILQTIALQLTAGDPADDLIHMLQDQEDKLEAEQDADDEFILVLENQCVDDLARLVDEIAQTRQRIQELNDLLDALKPIKQEKEKERANLEDFLALLIEKLAQIDAAKIEKDAEWAEEKEQHDSQTAIIQRAKDIIVGGLSASFLQSKATMQATVLTQVGQHFNNAKKQHFNRKGLTSIFRVLAQVANSQEIQAAASALEKIVGLCDQLLEKIAESRKIEKDDYDHWVKEYTTTKTQLEQTKADTIAHIEQLTIEINVLTKRISAAEQELAEQEIRLEQKIVQHDEREAFCDEAGKKYAHDREARDDERSIISDAIGLLMSKIRLLKKYVSDASSTLERPMI